MFSAQRLSEKYAFSPKNGPVPERPVNAYRKLSYGNVRQLFLRRS